MDRVTNLLNCPLLLMLELAFMLVRVVYMLQRSMIQQNAECCPLVLEITTDQPLLSLGGQGVPTSCFEHDAD